MTDKPRLFHRFALLLSLASPACSGQSGSAQGECAVGTAGCECYDNATCNDELVCSRRFTCTPPEDSDSVADPDSGSPGDPGTASAAQAEPQCFGSASSCSSGSPGSCSDIKGCRLTIGASLSTSDDKCVGTPTECSSFNEFSCEDQPGCHWGHEPRSDVEADDMAAPEPAGTPTPSMTAPAPTTTPTDDPPQMMPLPSDDPPPTTPAASDSDDAVCETESPWLVSDPEQYCCSELIDCEQDVPCTQATECLLECASDDDDCVLACVELDTNDVLLAVVDCLDESYDAP